jgi:hypothetical protein
MLVGIENSLNTSAVRLSIADSPITQSISLNLTEANDLNLQNGQVVRGFLKDGEILLKANGSFTQQQFAQLSANLPFVDYTAVRRPGGFQLNRVDRASNTSSQITSKLDSKQTSKLASSKFLWTNMSTRLAEYFGSALGSSSSEAKSLAAFLSANGLDARLINGEKIGNQFKSFANMGERSDSTGLNSFHDSLASVNKNVSKAESNLAGLLKGFISSGLNVLSQSFEAGLNQVNFPVFLLDGAPASISIDLSGGIDLSQFMNLQSYSEARKSGSDYIDSSNPFANDASESDDSGDSDTGSELDRDHSNGNDDQTKRWRSTRNIEDFLAGSVTNFKVLVSIDSEKSLLVDCAVNTGSKLIFANVWVDGDNYFFDLVSNNIDSLASRFNSQELSLFGYNIFNKEPPIYKQQPGLARSGNINLEA